MTITNDFVFIHFPKNAGTVVTACLEELYDKTTDKERGKSFRDYFSYIINREETNYCEQYKSASLAYNGKNAITQHQSCGEIPKKHQQKPIISSIRNPFEKYVSLYKYGSWRKKNNVSNAVILDKFPQFPDLTFKEYMDFVFNYDMVELKRKMEINLDIGRYSLHYLKMFSKDFLSILRNYTTVSDLKKSDFYNVEFLYTERIGGDLYNFLKKMGWPENRLQFILQKKQINVNGFFDAYKEYYDQQLIDLVKEKESLLFEFFPEYSF